MYKLLYFRAPNEYGQIGMDSYGKNLLLRPPRISDGKAVHRLIQRSPPLDLNSSYSYFLLCTHFADTCLVGELDGEPVAFVSAYILPRDPDRLFVWQLAVDERLRGQGLARRLITALLDSPACRHVRFLETTVSPSNTASRKVFEAQAERLGAPLEEEIFLSQDHFGEESHEEEWLLRIGPFTNHQRENPNENL